MMAMAWFSLFFIEFGALIEQFLIGISDNVSMQTLPLESFQKLFGSNIRAMLNWDLLKQHEALIETMVIDTHDEIASLFTVWHIGMDGAPASWDKAGACPLSIRETIAPSYQWNDQRKHTISSFQNHYLSSPESVNLILPVYRVNTGYVLLDSTHRVVAVHQAGINFSAMLVVINGPVDERILPDLRWHTRNH